jgi:hypothetical protein
MTITNDAVKIMASLELSDADEAGGRMSNQEITTGDVNNLFPDISRMDRTYGRVSMRKVFVSVQSSNNDLFLGSHTILSKVPEDPLVSVTLFNTDSHVDERLEAKGKIESYLSKATRAPFFLLGTQWEGQQTFSCWKETQSNPPEIGEVYVLFDGTTDHYVKVTDVVITEDYSVTYTSGSDVLTKVIDLIVVSISAPITVDIVAGEFDVSGDQTGTRIYNTQVADSAKYYGQAKLATPASADDTVISVDNIFTQLIPSATTETPIADSPILSTVEPLVESSQADISVTLETKVYNDGTTLYAPTPVKAGTLNMSIGASNSITDDGAGSLVSVSGFVSGGSIDYYSGKIILECSGGDHTSGTITYRVMSNAPQAPYTEEEAITIGNRGLTYTKTLNPIPSPGALVVQFMALGKWYSAYDAGDGSLLGEISGSVNFTTGTVTLTLDALPDVDSSILYSWGTGGAFGNDLNPTNYIEPCIDEEIVVSGSYTPGTLIVSWYSDAVLKTATADAAGVITGDGTGTVTVTDTGFRVIVTPTDMFDVGSAVTYDFDETDTPRITETHTHSVSGGAITISLGNTNIVPGSISLGYPVTAYRRARVNRSKLYNGIWSRYTFGSNIVTKRVRDDGVGGIVGLTGVTINYTAGTITFDPELDNGYQLYNNATRQWVPTTTNYTFEANTDVTATYRHTVETDTSQSSNNTLDDAVIKLGVDVEETMVAGSVCFEFNGKMYFDRLGVIYTDINTTTNAGVPAGSIDYDAQEIRLTAWSAGVVDFTLFSYLSYYGDYEIDTVTFRTNGAPLRDSSFSIRGVYSDDVDTPVISTADNNGDLSGSQLLGTVDAQTGIVRLAVGGGKQAVPSSLTYSAIILSQLPLDAEIVGLDPVRLPSDGRVPIFEAGYAVVIANTIVTDNASSGVDGAVITLTRDHQAEIVLKDADGTLVRGIEYTVDLVAGTVTLANPFNFVDGAGAPLSGVLKVHDRVEDMRLVSDVQLGGDITLVKGIAHDYTAGDTTVSSAVIHGDLYADVTNFFVEEADTGNWVNELETSNPLANYDKTNYPLIIFNDGSMTERWKIVFTNGTSFNLIGETVGLIASGNTSTVLAPTNPATNKPYFTMAIEGWGSGWQVGNTIRFNTVGAQAPTWVIRTVVSGDSDYTDDNFELQRRGDSD